MLLGKVNSRRAEEMVPNVRTWRMTSHANSRVHQERRVDVAQATEPMRLTVLFSIMSHAVDN